MSNFHVVIVEQKPLIPVRTRLTYLNVVDTLVSYGYGYRTQYAILPSHAAHAAYAKNQIERKPNRAMHTGHAPEAPW